jgi:hypothetical protein
MDNITSLNDGTRDERLAALAAKVEAESERPAPLEEVNNHVHTYYSFSPYSPTAVAWKARQAGLQAVGSVDHDSISAAGEMLEAGKLADIGTTVGYEVRVNFSGTALEGRKINNPDSTNLAYMVTHGVPRGKIAQVDAFLAPIRERRNERNQEQTKRMNQLLESAGAPTVRWEDVVALSRSPEGGSITERHLLYAVSKALIAWKGKGENLRSWVESNLTGQLPGRLAGYLDDSQNPHYEYDLLGSMKSTFLPRFFVQPDEQECIPVATAVEFGRSIHAIPAYAYLGDVGESPTGDKKAEQFEDSYLDELFSEISRIGFRAVTYMPPRNTIEQLRRVQELCGKHSLMEISGVDINSSRQVFTCPEVMQPEFRHLVASTWALIAHEKLVDHDESLSLFADGNGAGTTLAERIPHYAEVGQKMDRTHPEAAYTLIRW